MRTNAAPVCQHLNIASDDTRDDEFRRFCQDCGEPAPHTADEHCKVNPQTGECVECGVSWDEDGCPDCGGHAFHRDDCPQMGPYVTIPDYVSPVPCVLQAGVEWNGFECPAFTRETAERIVAEFNRNGVRAWYDAAADEFCFTNGDGDIDRFGKGEDGLYPIGAFCWVWERV